MSDTAVDFLLIQWAGRPDLLGVRRVQGYGCFSIRRAEECGNFDPISSKRDPRVRKRDRSNLGLAGESKVQIAQASPAVEVVQVLRYLRPHASPSRPPSPLPAPR